jgi:predicted nucleic acid-binding protein
MSLLDLLKDKPPVISFGDVPWPPPERKVVVSSSPPADVPFLTSSPLFKAKRTPNLREFLNPNYRERRDDNTTDAISEPSDLLLAIENCKSSSNFTKTDLDLERTLRAKTTNEIKLNSKKRNQSVEEHSEKCASQENDKVTAPALSMSEKRDALESGNLESEREKHLQSNPVSLASTTKKEQIKRRNSQGISTGDTISKSNVSSPASTTTITPGIRNLRSNASPVKVQENIKLICVNQSNDCSFINEDKQLSTKRKLSESDYLINDKYLTRQVKRLSVASPELIVNDSNNTTLEPQATEADYAQEKEDCQEFIDKVHVREMVPSTSEGCTSVQDQEDCQDFTDKVHVREMVPSMSEGFTSVQTTKNPLQDQEDCQEFIEKVTLNSETCTSGKTSVKENTNLEKSNKNVDQNNSLADSLSNNKPVFETTNSTVNTPDISKDLLVSNSHQEIVSFDGPKSVERSMSLSDSISTTIKEEGIDLISVDTSSTEEEGEGGEEKKDDSKLDFDKDLVEVVVFKDSDDDVDDDDDGLEDGEIDSESSIDESCSTRTGDNVELLSECPIENKELNTGSNNPVPLMDIKTTSKQTKYQNRKKRKRKNRKKNLKQGGPLKKVRTPTNQLYFVLIKYV